MDSACLEIQEVCPSQSVKMYLNTVSVYFKNKDDVNSLKVKNRDCGVDHITWPAEQNEEPLVQPLVEIVSK